MVESLWCGVEEEVGVDVVGDCGRTKVEGRRQGGIGLAKVDLSSLGKV